MPDPLDKLQADVAALGERMAEAEARADRLAARARALVEEIAAGGPPAATLPERAPPAPAEELTTSPAEEEPKPAPRPRARRRGKRPPREFLRPPAGADRYDGVEIRRLPDGPALTRQCIHVGE